MFVTTAAAAATTATATYLLTPRCRVLLEKLTGLQLVKKFPAFHGTRRFNTALRSVRHLSIPIPYTPPSPHPYAPHAQPISFFSILSPAPLLLCLLSSY